MIVALIDLPLVAGYRLRAYILIRSGSIPLVYSYLLITVHYALESRSQGRQIPSEVVVCAPIAAWDAFGAVEGGRLVILPLVYSLIPRAIYLWRILYKYEYPPYDEILQINLHCSMAHSNSLLYIDQEPLLQVLPAEPAIEPCFPLQLTYLPCTEQPLYVVHEQTSEQAIQYQGVIPIHTGQCPICQALHDRSYTYQYLLPVEVHVRNGKDLSN